MVYSASADYCLFIAGNGDIALSVKRLLQLLGNALCRPNFFDTWDVFDRFDDRFPRCAISTIDANEAAKRPVMADEGICDWADNCAAALADGVVYNVL